MNAVAGWTRFAATMFEPGMLKESRSRIARRMRSDSVAFGFRRDLGVAFAAPRAKVPLVIRPFRPHDRAAMVGIQPDATAEERWERASRERLLDSGMGRCFVAEAPDGRACYMQWLFGASDNAGLAEYFGGSFPALAHDEALLEGAYTPAAFRGQGIMPAAMAQIAEQGRSIGARSVVTFVGADNIASMKGCVRAGFRPHVQREESWRMMRRRTRFTDLPADFAATYATIFG